MKKKDKGWRVDPDTEIAESPVKSDKQCNAAYMVAREILGPVSVRLQELFADEIAKGDESFQFEPSDYSKRKYDITIHFKEGLRVKIFHSAITGHKGNLDAGHYLQIKSTKDGEKSSQAIPLKIKIGQSVSFNGKEAKFHQDTLVTRITEIYQGLTGSTASAEGQRLLPTTVGGSEGAQPTVNLARGEFGS
jgi:hypothetical protein